MADGNCVEVWRKSTHSTYNGNCVEVTDGIQVRDSKNPDLELAFTPNVWIDFINGVRDGC